ncbi:helicase HerA-like domain-containing protein [Reyranella sp.]|uniref:helicase HerA-like domain-containing protein n=1 Tax=Reyranella sp. TaxID=1929291 RepID=UPI003BAB43DD
MSDDTAIFVGAGETDRFLLLKYANRHGLVAGATGTGKTVTLQTIAEGFSAYGVPVFMADVKGDLSGIGLPGGDNPRAVERARQLEIEPYAGRAFPVIPWDLFGEKGHPVRTTVTEIGPVLMARLLQLNDTQEGVLNIVFKVADEQGLLLLDFKDLQSVLQWAAENAGSLTTRYGNVTKQSIGAIQRALLTLEQQGGERFFGEPALDLRDMIGRDGAGLGYVNILAADRLMQSPRLYATFLLWLLSELFEVMPEVGDLDRPKFVFFFDEAHLLFDDAPKALLDKIEQVVRLIRSKGVGVYFITQNPLDIPASVLGQLGNRVQHALRAFTPRDQKAVRTAAETFRPNPKFDAAQAIVELGVGEALVSFLDAKGVPEPVERCLVAPPQGRIGPATAAECAAALRSSPLAGRYEQGVDRDSAYEVLQRRAGGGQVEHEADGPESRPRRRGQYDAPPPASPGPWGRTRVPQTGEAPDSPAPRPRAEPRGEPRPAPAPRAPTRRSDTALEATLKSMGRAFGSTLVREGTRIILRGVLGSRRR